MRDLEQVRMELMKNLYLWEIPEEYPQKLVGRFCKSNKTDRFTYQRATKVNSFEEIPVVEFEGATIDDFTNYDCVFAGSSLPLVSGSLSEILKRHLNDVELWGVVIRASDGDLLDYQILNVVSTIKGIDHEKSAYSTLPNSNQIYGIRKLVYKKGSLGVANIARDEEYMPNILVSEELRDEVMKVGGLGTDFKKIKCSSLNP